MEYIMSSLDGNLTRINSLICLKEYSSIFFYIISSVWHIYILLFVTILTCYPVLRRNRAYTDDDS